MILSMVLNMILGLNFDMSLTQCESHYESLNFRPEMRKDEQLEYIQNV